MVLVVRNVLYTLVCLNKLLIVPTKQYASTKWYVYTSIIFTLSILYVILLLIRYVNTFQNICNCIHLKEPLHM
jgi:hypothetical protein